MLRALHAHEILIGMLTDTGANRMTGASVALRVLAEARQDGLTDEEILARSPTVLALTAPQVARAPELPAEATAVYVTTRARAAATTASSARPSDSGCAGCRSSPVAPPGSSACGWRPPVTSPSPSSSAT